MAPTIYGVLGPEDPGTGQGPGYRVTWRGPTTRPCGDWRLAAVELCGRRAAGGRREVGGGREQAGVQRYEVQHLGDTTPSQTIQRQDSRSGQHHLPKHTQHRPLSTVAYSLGLLQLSPPVFFFFFSSSIPHTLPSMASLQIPHRPRPNGDHHGATKAVILVSPIPSSLPFSAPFQSPCRQSLKSRPKQVQLIY